VSHDDNTGRGAKVLADGNTCMGFADRGSVQVFCRAGGGGGVY